MESSDDVLIAAYLDGDDETLERMYCRYAAHLLGFLSGIGGGAAQECGQLGTPTVAIGARASHWDHLPGANPRCPGSGRLSVCRRRLVGEYDRT